MSEPTYSRRSIVSGGVIAAGLTAATQSTMAFAADATRGWQPVSEPQDAWLDKPGTRHRLVIDSANAAAASEAVSMAETFYASNASGYRLAPESLGVVIILRHLATPFAYNDDIWTRFGAYFAQKLGLTGDDAIRAVHGNPLLGATTSTGGSSQPKGHHADVPTLASLASKGARYAVCGAATAYFARMLATTGTTPARVERDLHDNLIPAGVLMASGIVAVNRAQEHGYAFLSAMP